MSGEAYINFDTKFIINLNRKHKVSYCVQEKWKEGKSRKVITASVRNWLQNLNRECQPKNKQVTRISKTIPCRLLNACKMNEHIRRTKLNWEKAKGVDWLHLSSRMHKLKLIGLELMRLFRVTDRLMTGSSFRKGKKTMKRRPAHVKLRQALTTTLHIFLFFWESHRVWENFDGTRWDSDKKAKLQNVEIPISTRLVVSFFCLF